MSTTNSRQRKRLRWAGLIMGVIGAAVGLIAFFWWAMGAWQLVRFHPDEWAFMLLTPIRWGVIAVAWKWELIGGVLLILDSLFVATFSGYLPLALRFSVSLPLLAAGVLFLLSWFLSWREGCNHPGATGG